MEENIFSFFSTPPIQLLPGDFGHQLKRIMALVWKITLIEFSRSLNALLELFQSSNHHKRISK